MKQHVENLNQVAEKLEEKHHQITELENLVQRMEKVSPGELKGFFLTGLGERMEENNTKINKTLSESTLCNC